MNPSKASNSRLVRLGLAFLLTLILASTASATYCIGDFVWFDLNENGLQDDGEPGVPDVTVRAYECTNNSMVLLEETKTDEFGRYKIDFGYDNHTDWNPIKPEHLLVEFQLPAQLILDGYIFTQRLVEGEDSSIDSNPKPNGQDDCSVPTWQHGANCLQGCWFCDKNFDAGVVLDDCNGQIGDSVWIDTDSDGIQDVDEHGINGVTLTLDDGNGNIITTATFTGGPLTQPGYYLFDDLCAGTYTVAVDDLTVPAQYQATAINAGAADEDSDNPAGTIVFLANNGH